MLKDLHRCLDEYTSELVTALAAVWGAVSVPADQKATIERTVQQMSTPAAVKEVVDGLSDKAVVALAELRRAQGVLPGHRLLMPFGTIRRLGPAGLARERPWLDPVSATEELYYRGLVYRAYGTVDDYVGEILFVPTALMDALAFTLAIHEWYRVR